MAHEDPQEKSCSPEPSGTRISSREACCSSWVPLRSLSLLLLQCSLTNPRDGGAWWAAIYGVAQSWTQLKRLSRSSSSSLTLTYLSPVQCVIWVRFCFWQSDINFFYKNKQHSHFPPGTTNSIPQHLLHSRFALLSVMRDNVDGWQKPPFSCSSDILFFKDFWQPWWRSGHLNSLSSTSLYSTEKSWMFSC